MRALHQRTSPSPPTSHHYNSSSTLRNASKQWLSSRKLFLPIHEGQLVLALSIQTHNRPFIFLPCHLRQNNRYPSLHQARIRAQARRRLLPFLSYSSHWYQNSLSVAPLRHSLFLEGLLEELLELLHAQIQATSGTTQALVLLPRARILLECLHTWADGPIHYEHDYNDNHRTCQASGSGSELHRNDAYVLLLYALCACGDCCALSVIILWLDDT